VGEVALPRRGGGVAAARAAPEAVLLDAAAAGRVVGPHVRAVGVKVGDVEVEVVAGGALGRGARAGGAAAGLAGGRAARHPVLADARALGAAGRAHVHLGEAIAQVHAHLPLLVSLRRRRLDRGGGVHAVVRAAAVPLVVDLELRGFQLELVGAVGV